MFDLEAFRACPITHRIEEVPVPRLAPFFSEGEPALWRIRGMTGEEIARARESGARHKAVAVAIQAMVSQSQSTADKVDAMKSILGFGTEVPEDLAQRLDHLVFGSVYPAIDRNDAVRLFAMFPVIAYELTNKILVLSEQGPDLGKVTRSIETNR